MRLEKLRGWLERKRLKLPVLSLPQPTPSPLRAEGSRRRRSIRSNAGRPLLASGLLFTCHPPPPCLLRLFLWGTSCPYCPVGSLPRGMTFSFAPGFAGMPVLASLAHGVYRCWCWSAGALLSFLLRSVSVFPLRLWSPFCLHFLLPFCPQHQHILFSYRLPFAYLYRLTKQKHFCYLRQEQIHAPLPPPKTSDTMPTTYRLTKQEHLCYPFL